MWLKKAWAVLLLLSPVLGFTQFQDDFTDGDFSANPTWSGTTSKFIVNGSNQLQSNGSSSSTDTLYLTTPSTLIDSAEWNFYLKLDFNPTASTNYTKIYLVSDQSDLTASLNGYYLRIGESGSTDTLELWRQDGTTDTRILVGSSSFGNPVEATVKVTRDELGNWEFFTDHAAGTNFSSEGTVLDNTHTSTAFFGVYARYSTTSRFDQYFFDDLSVSLAIGDTTKPTIDSLKVISATELDVYFSEKVDVTTGQNSTNYLAAIAQENPTSAVIDASDSSLVHLTFSTNFVNGVVDTLNVTNVEDRSANAIGSIDETFFYLVTVPAAYRDVVFNEVFADPTPQVALPSAEFVEIRNSSSNIYDLSGWKFVNTSTEKTFPSHLLYPDSFLIICSISDTALFQPYGDVIGFSSWTALSNSADSLTLIDNNATVIDVVKYEVAWYQDAVKDDGGWSLELINPISNCISSASSNWIASTNTDGGTPGSENSVLDTVPDVTAPTVVNAAVIDSNTVAIIFNEAMDSASVANGTYSTTSLTQSAVVVGSSPYDSVYVTFTTNIDTGIFYTTTVTGVTDCPGNTISGSNTADFIIANQPQAGDVIINEIFADPSPQVGLPTEEFVELHNLTSGFIELQNCKLTGATISDGTIAPNGYVILCSMADTGLYSSFGDVVGISNWGALTNSGELVELENQNGQIVDAVTYELSWYNDDVKEDGGWSLERINPTTTCSSFNNWSASTDVAGGTPGAQNSIFDNSPDVVGPSLIKIALVDSNKAALIFDESMDSTSLTAGTYVADNGLTTSAVEVGSFPYDSVYITFTTNIDTGITYTVIASGVTDCPGNAIINSSQSFVVGFNPLPGNVIINELLADPTPTVGLPEGEYVELFNRTNKLIDLENCDFDGVTILSGNIPSNGFAIICAESDTALFSPFGHVVGIANFPSLTNGGEQVTFSNADGLLVDEVTYTDDWYQDGAKDDGGWSLERINPDAVCSFEANWIASADATGGTPGAQNSVFDTTPDTDSPNVTSVSILDSNKVKIWFDEPMDSLSIMQPGYTVDNGLTVDSILPVESPFSEVTILLDANIDTAIVYTLTVTGVTDCPGNAIGQNTATFVLGYPAQPGEVVINEIMCDPSPAVSLPEREFVELYNTSSKLLDLSQLLFDGEPIPSNTLLGAGQYLLLCSDDDTAEFSPFGYTVGLNSWPSLTNGGELIDLANDQGTIIDEVDYTDDWYQDANKDDGGWSLEKKNPTAICNNANNWLAANNFLGGTPGAQNSVFDNTPDQNVPGIESIVVSGAQAVLVTFDEPMDSSSLVNGTYTVSGGVSVISATTTTSPFYDVFLFFNNPVDTGITYTLSVANVTDCPGNLIGDNDSITFLLAHEPAFGEVVINEILPDPTEVVGLPDQEFIELYNTTDRLLNLGGSEFEGLTIPENSLIEANSYVIVCKDEDTSLYSPFGAVIGMPSWPSLSNSGEELDLRNRNGQLLDILTYSSAWYNDEEKDNGGWTLERKNPFSECNFENTWAASTNELGGTPGQQNSIFDLSPDVVAPNLDQVIVYGEQHIDAVFDKGMDLNSLLNGTFTIDGIVIDSVRIDSNVYFSCHIYLGTSLVKGQVYTLQVDNVLDCPGNSIGANKVDFALPEDGEVGDLIINEILFDPTSTGEDFVEVYNNSDKYIDLSKWSLATFDFETNEVDKEKEVGGTQHVLFPQQYALLTKDTASIRQEYPLSQTEGFIQMASLPTYSNSDGVVILLTSTGEIADRFDYDSDMHFPLLVDEEGVSLERLDFDRETNDYTNWHSAAENVGFATPGYKNSQAQQIEDNNEVISIQPEIFSPNNDGFDDVVSINYQLDKPGYVGTILIYDAKGRLARELMNNELLAPSGTISWDGTNTLNEKSRIGIYVIVFSAYHTDGEVVKEKTSVVLASPL